MRPPNLPDPRTGRRRERGAWQTGGKIGLDGRVRTKMNGPPPRAFPPWQNMEVFGAEAYATYLALKVFGVRGEKNRYYTVLSDSTAAADGPRPR